MIASTSASHCTILNGGDGSWAFDPLAQQLSAALGVPIGIEPRGFNYLLHLDSIPADFSAQLFIPISAIRLAADKRLLATAFAKHGVPTPRTILLETFQDVTRFVAANHDLQWCLKYPTGCGANGHRLITSASPDPAQLSNWPRPFVVQEFIPLARPEVYRLYAADGELFGWNARRFPTDVRPSPWVAHARGARYELAHDPPPAALQAAQAALQATGLDGGFGCVDLLRRPSGEWLVLEVGTDGLFNYVDRDLGHPELEAELLSRITRAFWQRAAAYDESAQLRRR